mmetsp:Transcript_29689/g.58061  ORF Transcript_29689/g.58061 Transcript_29689/m.58061 type:complete len:290 (+) Transcript_29689:3-872(+)
MLRGQASRPGMKQVAANTGAMRDLSGRRLRHVEQDQKLQEWQEEAGKRKAEKEAEKQEKRQKRAQEIHGAAEDYVALAGIDADEVKDAVLKGIEAEQRAKEAKRIEDEAKKKLDKQATKKLSSLFGDEDDSSSSSDTEAPPSSSTAKSAAKKGKKNTAQKPAAAAATGAGGGTPAAAAAPAVAAAAAASKGNGDKEQTGPPQAAKPPQPAEEDKSKKQEEKVFQDIDLAKVKSLDALLELGADRLKAALSKRGMKCGGSPKDRAERLWSIKGVAQKDWPSSVMAPPAKK